MGKLVMPRKGVTESYFIECAKEAKSLEDLANILDTQPSNVRCCAQRHGLVPHIARFQKHSGGRKKKITANGMVECPACNKLFSVQHSQKYCPECRRIEDLPTIAMGPILLDTGWEYRAEHAQASPCISAKEGKDYGKVLWTPGHPEQPNKSCFGQIYFAAGAAARV